jgi:hypothetical protein
LSENDLRKEKGGDEAPQDFKNQTITSMSA